MKIAQVLKLTFPSALVASLCCLTPLVFVLFGASATSFGVVLFTRVLGPYEWAFFLAGGGFLAVSLVIYFRTRGVCTLDQARTRRREVINTILLVAVCGLVVFGALYGAVALGGHAAGLW